MGDCELLQELLNEAGLTARIVDPAVVRRGYSAIESYLDDYCGPCDNLVREGNVISCKPTNERLMVTSTGDIAMAKTCPLTGAKGTKR
jgi:hypothetical protein